jgi:hypothetical protein
LLEEVTVKNLRKFNRDMSHLVCSIAQNIPEFLDIVTESELRVR